MRASWAARTGTGLLVVVLVVMATGALAATTSTPTYAIRPAQDQRSEERSEDRADHRERGREDRGEPGRGPSHDRPATGIPDVQVSGSGQHLAGAEGHGGEGAAGGQCDLPAASARRLLAERAVAADPGATAEHTEHRGAGAP